MSEAEWQTGCGVERSTRMIGVLQPEERSLRMDRVLPVDPRSQIIKQISHSEQQPDRGSNNRRQDGLERRMGTLRGGNQKTLLNRARKAGREGDPGVLGHPASSF